jgi:hypothetical protein
MTGFGIVGFAGLAAMPQILLCTTAVMTVMCIELPRSLGMVELMPVMFSGDAGASSPIVLLRPSALLASSL